MTYRRMLWTAICLSPIILIWLEGFAALDNIRQAYGVVCGNRVGLSSQCISIDASLETLTAGIFLMIILYAFAAEGVRRILSER